MFGLNNSSGIPVMPAITESVLDNPLWFTEGGSGVPPSYPGKDWFNVIQAELLYILSSAGIEPSQSDTTQLATAIKQLISSATSSDSSLRNDLESENGASIIGGVHLWTAAIAVELGNAFSSGKVHFWVAGNTAQVDNYYLYKPDGIFYTGFSGIIPASPTSGCTPHVIRNDYKPTDFGGASGGADIATILQRLSNVIGYYKEYVASEFNAINGSDVTPDGVAHNRSIGRVYNPTQQKYLPFFGQETLQHWFSKFAGASNKIAGDTTIRAIAVSGDSTSYGIGATYGTPTYLLEDIAEQRGYTNVGVINRGQSGKACFDWVSTYLSGDLTCNSGTAPDLLILRWGANDPYFGRTVDQFIADLRSGLTAIRASKSVSQMSILLMTPTSMNDVEKGRTEVWSEQIGPAIRQAARDFQCAFIDTYALFQNSHDAADVWMDRDTSFSATGRAIHPRDVLYEHIVGKIADMIFPEHGTDWKTNSVRNTSAGDVLSKKTGNELPNTYFAGISMHRIADTTGSANGGPYNGIVFTFKQADGAVLQICTPLAKVSPSGTDGTGISVRLGWNNAWSDWFGSQVSANAILSNGWSNFGGIYKKFNYQLSLEGRLFLNGIIKPGTTTDGTVIFTLPIGYRPQATEIFMIPSEAGVCRLTISSDGTAKIYGFNSGGTYICLNAVSFKVSTT